MFSREQPVRYMFDSSSVPDIHESVKSSRVRSTRCDEYGDDGDGGRGLDPGRRVVWRGERLRLRRGSRRRALRACGNEPRRCQPPRRDHLARGRARVRSGLRGDTEARTLTRERGAPDRSIATREQRARRRQAGRSAHPASNSSPRRSPDEAGGPSATVWPCSIAPRTRSHNSVRRRWPWHSSPRLKRVVEDVRRRSSGAATPGSDPQRSYRRRRSSTCELVRVVVPTGAPLPGELGTAAGDARLERRS